jgi:hypothetical protein
MELFAWQDGERVSSWWHEPTATLGLNPDHGFVRQLGLRPFPTGAAAWAPLVQNVSLTTPVHSVAFRNDALLRQLLPDPGAAGAGATPPAALDVPAVPASPALPGAPAASEAGEALSGHLVDALRPERGRKFACLQYHGHQFGVYNR